MLAAAAEHEPGDPELLALALESQRMWPAFGRALEAIGRKGETSRNVSPRTLEPQ